MSTFNDRFISRSRNIKSLLCTGFDPDPDRLPIGYQNTLSDWIDFTQTVLDSIADITTAVKCNLGFYEALPFGMELLHETIRLVKEKNIPIIADAKRGDIPNTAKAYARSCFELFGFDAVTVHPYMGLDTLEPFYSYKDRACIVLCLTSNDGAKDYQLRGEPPLYEQVAEDIAKLNETHGNLWLVVGATRSSEPLKKVRALAPNVPFLVPGAGSQGGDVKNVIECAGKNLLINASRSILYSAAEKNLLAKTAREEGMKIVDLIRTAL